MLVISTKKIISIFAFLSFLALKLPAQKGPDIKFSCKGQSWQGALHYEVWYENAAGWQQVDPQQPVLDFSRSQTGTLEIRFSQLHWSSRSASKVDFLRVYSRDIELTPGIGLEFPDDVEDLQPNGSSRATFPFKRPGLQKGMTTGTLRIRLQPFYDENPCPSQKILIELDFILQLSPRDQQETDAWQKASNADSLLCYEAYLADYPAGWHRKEAQEKLQQIKAFDQKAQQQLQVALQQSKGDLRKKLAAYEQYLRQRPSRYLSVERRREVQAKAEEVRDNLRFQQCPEGEELWVQAQEKDDFPSYAAYLERCPLGGNAEKAKERQYQIRETCLSIFEKAVGTQDMPSYRRYIEQCEGVNAQHMQQARQATLETGQVVGQGIQEAGRNPGFLTTQVGKTVFRWAIVTILILVLGYFLLAELSKS